MDIKPSQQQIIYILNKKSGKAQKKELQEEVGFKPNAFRARISELRRMGLIEWDNNFIWLTEKGKDFVKESAKVTEAVTITNKNTNKLSSLLHEEREEDDDKIKATIVISDLHLGDENVMLETYKSAVNNLINKLKEIAKEEKISKIDVILNGDIVAGRGIFRGQEAQNIFNKGNIQVLYASAYILDLHRELSQIAPVQYFVIKGNHDTHRGDNYAWELADKLRSFGLNAYYAGHQRITNLGNKEKQHWALIEHGYGGSDYYPISYDFLRNTWKKLNWLNRKQVEQGRKEIERVIVGHSHWLVTNIRQDPYWAIDVSGGFQRNERIELGKNQRPAGFILYVFDPDRDGLTVYDWKDGLRLYEIVPDEEVMLKELFDPALELKNRMDAPRKLIELYDYLKKEGLIKKEG